MAEILRTFMLLFFLTFSSIFSLIFSSVDLLCSSVSLVSVRFNCFLHFLNVFVSHFLPVHLFPSQVSSCVWFPFCSSTPLFPALATLLPS